MGSACDGIMACAESQARFCAKPTWGHCNVRFWHLADMPLRFRMSASGPSSILVIQQPPHTLVRWTRCARHQWPIARLEECRKLLTAFIATVLIASSAIIWKAEAASGIGYRPPPNSYSLIEKVRCYCGPYGCSCVPRSWPGYRYRNYGFGSLRPYAYRPSPYYGYRWRQ